MGTFLVEEVGEAGGQAIESLARAKVLAQKRARASQRPVIVRDRKTGEELARYEPEGPANDGLSPVLAQLRDSSKRLQKMIDRRSDDPPKKK